MSRKGNLRMMLLSIGGILAAIMLFIYLMITSDGGSIFLYIFGLMGLFVVMIILVIFFALRFSRPAFRGSNIENMTKACGACGHTIGITELTCPRCLTIQSGLPKK
jgi:hypothetical protein